MKFFSYTLIACLLGFVTNAHATVTVEIAIGSLPDISSGNAGILVADIARNGFQSPQEGVLIAAGNSVGPTDDLIVGVFAAESGSHWDGGVGFSGILPATDLEDLGLTEGTPLKFYWLPGKNPGQVVAAGEVWHCFREDSAGASGGTIGLLAPDNYGVFRISQLTTDLGGDFDSSNPANSGDYETDGAYGIASNVTATLVTADNIEVSWGAVAGATGYRVYRGTSPDFASASLLQTTSDLSFVDIGVGTGEYYYWIESDFGAGSSLASLQNAPASTTFSSPDLTIGKNGSQKIGLGVISTNPNAQRLKILVRKRKTGRGFSFLNNQGTKSGSLLLGGSRGNSKFKMTYIRMTSPGANITGAVRVNVYQSRELAPGESELVRIQVKPTARLKDRRGKYRVNLTGRHASLVSERDTVRLEVTRKP